MRIQWKYLIIFSRFNMIAFLVAVLNQKFALYISSLSVLKQTLLLVLTCIQQAYHGKDQSRILIMGHQKGNLVITQQQDKQKKLTQFKIVKKGKKKLHKLLVREWNADSWFNYANTVLKGYTKREQTKHQ